MVDKTKAAEAKARGNAAFQAKKYQEAVDAFTEAIKHDPSDHVFYSNRSGAYASMEEYEKAEADGAKCVELKPDWPKGYSRKGLAEFHLTKYDNAAETYKAGLKLAPEDAPLKEGLQKAMDAKYEIPGSGAPPRRGAGAGAGGGGGGGGSPFGGGIDMAKLAAAAARTPKIAEYMKDEDLMAKLNMLSQLGGSNQQMGQQMLLQFMQQDPRLMELFMASQGIDVSNINTDDLRSAGAEGGEAPSARSAPPPKKDDPPPPPEDLRTPEQKEADEFKTKGNELYKKKQFAEAIEQYDKAIEKVPDDITYYNNKCAVWVEMGKENPEYLDKVLDTCRDLVAKRYEMNSALPGGASFEKVAKVFCRMASVYEKKNDYNSAIEMYHKALTEDNSRTTRNALRDLERAKEKHEKDAYLDPAKAEEHREKGNEFFKSQEWAKAKVEYDEAIKRNPKDAKLYSNRAAVLTKLMAHPDALRDLEECLKLDPTFIKAYSRKGVTHFFMKEYHKSLQAYEAGLKLDPKNEECLRGREQVVAKIQETNRSGEVDEEQVRHAMADPEIQNILKDPQINIFLKQMQENPAAAQDMMSDPKIADAMSKLMAAGILRTG